MPDVTIIQLSDLHFGAGAQNPHPSAELADQVSGLAATLHNPVVLASGDITYKASAQGYSDAVQFFDRVRQATGLDRDRFLFCPGNHDCHATTHFRSFDAFSYRMRRDDACTFSSHNLRTVTVGGLTVLLLNSAHHLDHRFGLVDEAALRAVQLQSPENTLAVSHHHLVPTHRDDVSTTRNAYGLLTVLDEKRVPLLLHGHQHLARGLPVGSTPVHVFGVNSFNFAYRGGQNAVGIADWKAGHLRFERRIYVSDGPGAASGRYQMIDQVSIR